MIQTLELNGLYHEVNKVTSMLSDEKSPYADRLHSEVIKRGGRK